MSTPYTTLPALRVLADMADKLPVVIVDTREQEPLPIRHLPVSVAGLYTGDYSVAGLEDIVSIERKSIPDLVSCCAGSNRERFEHELHRLRGYRFKRLLVIGTRADIEAGTYRSNIRPASVLGSLAAWEIRYDVPVVYAATADEGAVVVERWAWYAAREIVTACNALARRVMTPA
jgi:DNA excision repair protein ERCC-4